MKMVNFIHKLKGGRQMTREEILLREQIIGSKDYLEE